MPQIIVTTGSARDPREGEILLRERVNASDFESARFATNLIERLGWAVGDATALEQRPDVWVEDEYEHAAEADLEPGRAPAAEADPERDRAPVGIA